MSKSQISKRYAKALFDLAADQNVISEVLADLSSLEEIINNNKVLRSFLTSPVASKLQLVKVIDVFKEKSKIENVTFNFLNILIENKRLGLLPNIKSEFVVLSRQKDKIIEVDVLSVYKLSGDALKSIEESIKSYASSNVVINNIIEPAIIGGLVVKIGSKVIDASLQNSVKRLGQKMKEAV